MTVVYISHRLEEIYRICDRVTVLRDGKKIITAQIKDLPQTELVKHMLGREITQQVPKERVSIGEVKLSVRELYPKEKGENISFDLKAGEILGIVGSIGAGKSEVRIAYVLNLGDLEKALEILRRGIEEYRSAVEAGPAAKGHAPQP